MIVYDGMYMRWRSNGHILNHTADNHAQAILWTALLISLTLSTLGSARDMPYTSGLEGFFVITASQMLLYLAIRTSDFGYGNKNAARIFTFVAMVLFSISLSAFFHDPLATAIFDKVLNVGVGNEAKPAILSALVTTGYTTCMGVKQIYDNHKKPGIPYFRLSD